ncbi:MAG: polymerase subunit sigma-70, partial [Acidimicrobiales bacterium]|nr:polymerase subunit sigma-70 [Acidimicrobiales bacterium]
AHYLGLLRCIRLLVDDPADAEDIVQETFVRAHRSLEGVLDHDREAAYLRSTALNLARSRLRHLRVVRRHAFEPPSPVEHLLNAERPAVLAALRHLPVRQRECVVLRYYLDLSEQEIATLLGISTGSVKTHASRALAALAPALEELR